MKTYEVTVYDAEDCQALDMMSKKEVAEVLDNIEGSWMPGRPNEYYSGEGMNEHDFSLLKVCKAIDLAAKWLKEDAENDNISRNEQGH